MSRITRLSRLAVFPYFEMSNLYAVECPPEASAVGRDEDYSDHIRAGDQMKMHIFFYHEIDRYELSLDKIKKTFKDIIEAWV